MIILKVNLALYPPSVSVLPAEGLIVNETGEAVLTCSFSANPPNVTEVVWYKDGKPAKQYPLQPMSNSLPKNLKGGPPSAGPTFVPSNKLVLDRIMRSEAGSYSCHSNRACIPSPITNIVLRMGQNKDIPTQIGSIHRTRSFIRFEFNVGILISQNTQSTV
ncbi:uncharacterized protein TNCV_1993721 [Trichonephila clavipes]|nr:uncharacterized protein TNCV_1993721 [Trichonephila clavipes]